MRSVVSIKDDVARFTHLTVREFLTDKTRHGQPWSVDLVEQQHFISSRCFEIMEDAHFGLKFKICRLESSDVPNSEIVDLDGRIEECISPELKYSALNWWDHTSKVLELQSTSSCSQAGTSKLLSSMEKLLCTERTLYWLEVLGLMKRLDAAQWMLRDINQRSEVSAESHTFMQCNLTMF